MVAAFQVLSGLIFAAFGSAELQSWGKDVSSSSNVEVPKVNYSEDGIILKVLNFSNLPHASAVTAENKR